MAKRSRTKRRGRKKLVAKSEASVETPIQSNAEAPEPLGTSGEQKSDESLSTAAPTAFEQVIAQSKEAIAEETERRVGARRGRGRPPKHRPVSAGTSERVGAPSTEQASPVSSQSPVAPPPDISKALVLPLIAVSKIPARNYHCAELALTDEEATACAEALNQILVAFVPDQNTMSPKTAAVVMGAITFGSIGFSKYLILQNQREAMKAEKKKQEQLEVQDVIRAEQERTKTTAADFYRREVTA